MGIPQEQAEAHAEAAREFIMVELVTRQDLDTARRELQSAIDTTRRELESALDNLGLRLTVRMGIMLSGGVDPSRRRSEASFIELLQLVLAVGSDNGIVLIEYARTKRVTSTPVSA